MPALSRGLIPTLAIGWLAAALSAFGTPAGAEAPPPPAPSSSPQPAARPAADASAADASAADASAALAEVRSDLKALHDWLDRYPQGPRWRRYLRSDDLLVELARGAEADRRVVAEILKRYKSGAKGLANSHFNEVRRALHDWREELTAADLEPLAELVRSAADQFRPIRPEDVASAKASLQQAVAELKAWLATAGARDRQGWTEHLRLDEFDKQLAAEGKPDLRALNRVLGSFYQDDAGLEFDRFIAVREALRRYMNVVLFDDPTLVKAYADQLNELARRLEQYRQEGTADDRAAIGRLLGWLDRAGQADSVIQAVRRRFAYPNAYLQASEEFVAAGFRDTVDRTAPVHQTIMGTAVRGQAHTTGTISACLIPDDNRAAFRLQLIGIALSDNVGFNRGVRIYSNGRTRIHASKVLYLDGDQLLAGLGLKGLPATAKCDTQTHLQGVSANCGLIEHIAWKRAQQSRGTAERIASEKAEQRVAQEVDEQARDLIAESRQRFRERVRGPLRRRDALPQRFQLRSTAADLLVRVLQSNRGQVAAPGLPPTVDDGSDLSLRLHETTVGNFSESAIGGRTVTDGDLREFLAESDRPIPEALSPESDPWSITFAPNQPVVAEFRGGTVRIALRGRRFTRDRSAVNDNVEISAVYRLARSEESGDSILQRDGDVLVDFVGQKSLKIQQVAFKTFLQSKFGALFAEEIPLENLELPERWRDIGKMLVQQFDAAEGWLTVAWRLGSPDDSPTPPSVARRMARRD